MKCHKCAKPAVVHLTEIVSGKDGKRAVQIHLCYSHAVESGIVTPQGGDQAVETGQSMGPSLKPLLPSAEDETMAIVPAPPGGLAVVRSDSLAIRPVDAETCPVCGGTWQQFKQTGRMGCPHDYTVFAARLEPLIKRAQENFKQHVGKVPAKIVESDPARSVMLARLQRELKHALEKENYEQAARVRDQLRHLTPD